MEPAQGGMEPAQGGMEPVQPAPVNPVVVVTDGPPPPQITFTEFNIPRASQPGWLTLGPDGQLWFTHQSTAPSAVTKVSPNGRDFNRYETGRGNTGPRSITSGPENNIYYGKQDKIGVVSRSGDDREIRIDNDGDAGGVVLGPDGAIWFTQPVRGVIGRMTRDGRNFDEFDIPTPGSGPFPITVGGDGNIWFAESSATANKIGRLTLPGGDVTEFAIPTPGANPQSMTLGPEGNIWFTERDIAAIGRVTQEGEITEFALPSGNAPFTIATGPDGNLWFTLSGAANAIGRITPEGHVAEYKVPTAGSDPFSIAVGPNDDLWFTALSANKIVRITDLDGGGNVNASEGGASPDPLSVEVDCNVDADCRGSGRACGGDVCGTEGVCVLAVFEDPGTCQRDQDCWCQSEGARCEDNSCSFILPGGAN